MGVFRRKRGVGALKVARGGKKGKTGGATANNGTNYTLGLRRTSQVRETMGPRNPQIQVQGILAARKLVIRIVQLKFGGGF